MDEKLNNEDFVVKRVDGTATLETDANKIKLKMVSFAAVMDVKAEFMLREKHKMFNNVVSQHNADSKPFYEQIKVAKQDEDYNNVTEDIYNFGRAKKRFTQVAKKALKLPEENREELASKGVTEYNGEKVSMEDINSAANETDKYANAFANIDSEAIKKEVENVINSQGDYIAENVNADNFEGTVKIASDEVIKNIDEKQSEKATSNDADATKTEEDTKITKDDLANIFANPDLVKTDDGMVDNQPDSSKEKEEPVEKEETSMFSNAEPAVEGTVEETKVEEKGIADNTYSMSTENNPLFTQQDAFMPYNDSDIFKNATFAPAIGMNDEPVKEEEVKTTDENTSKVEDSSAIDFGNDKSMQELLESLQKSNQELESRSQELTSSISSAKSQVDVATKAKTEAERERDAAKEKAEEAKRQVDLFKSYMPKIQDERRLQAERKKTIQGQEEELQKTKDELASINNATDVYKKDTDRFNEDYANYLEELRKLRSSLTGDSDSFDVDLGKGRSR